MADTATVGILKTMLTMDTASYDAGAKKAASSAKSVRESVKGLKDEIQKITPQAERMVKALGGDKLLYTANSLTAAVTKLGGASKLTDAEQARVNKTLNDAITKYQKLGQEAPRAMVELERATRKAGDGTNTLKGHVIALSAAAGTMAAQLAGQAIRSVIRIGREAIESAGHLVDLSAQTGLSTTTLQRMDAVAGQTGSTLDAMTSAAFKLGDRLSGGGDSVRAAVNALGLDFEKLRQQKLDQQFETAVVALGKMQNATVRNDAAVELFGIRLAKVALGAAKDYQTVADAAKAATEEQLLALDAIGDRLDKLQKDFAATWKGVIADAAFAADEFKRLGWWDLLKMGALAGPNLPDVLADLGQARAQAELKRAQAAKDAKTATEQNAKAEIDYGAALKEAEAQLKKLDATQRQAILDAQKYGAETEDIIETLVRFGVPAKHAEAVLRLLNGEVKAGEAATKKYTKAQEDAAEAAKKWHDGIRDLSGAFTRWVQVVDGSAAGRKDLMDFFTAMPPLIKATAASLDADLLPATQNALVSGSLTVEPPDLAALRNQNASQKLKAELDDRVRLWQEYAESVRQTIHQIFAPIVGGISGALGDLLFGTGTGGQKPKRGTMSAEDYTRAMREFESRWDSFLGRLTQGFKDFGRNILSMFANEILGGMVRALAGSTLGQRLGGWLVKGLGIAGGGGSGLLGTGVSAAAGAIGLGGGAGILGASSAPSLATLLGPAPAGAAAAGGGIGGAIAGFATNPITIGAAAAIGVGLLLNKLGAFKPGRRPGGDQAQGQFRGWRDPAMVFAPPSLTVPSMTGTSFGDFGRSAVDRAEGLSAGTVHNHYHNWNTIDARSTRRFVESPSFTNSFGRVVENNTGFVTSRLSRAINR